MSHFSENYSHGKKFKVNSDGFPFTTLKEVIEENGHKTLVVNGVFSYKAKYGTRPVLIADGLKIHLPDHCLKDVENIVSDSVAIDLINNGKCGFKTSEYTDDKGNKRYSGSFIDI